MPARATPLYSAVVDAHRRKLDRLAQRRGVERLRPLYDRALDSVMRRIRASTASGAAPFTLAIQRMVVAQVRAAQIALAPKLTDEMGTVSREAQEEALAGVIADVKKLERKFTGVTPVLPVEEAARFAGVIDKRRTSLLKMHRSSFANYGAAVVADVEDEMGISLLAGESMDDAAARVSRTIGGEFWRAERIVRTECAWAFSASTADGVKEIAQTVDDLWLRWVELVSDGGQPLDDRVGEDSVAMHGQVTKPGGMFTCPPKTRTGQKVSDSLAYEQIAHPPNRPNDRATVVAWRPDWGGYAWQWRGERRVPVGQ